ncbi:MAG: hypothetical protein ACRBN8_19745 [Nannocystales bacterium]
MTSLSRTPNQLLRVATRLARVFAEGDIAPTATAVLVNGQARGIPVTRLRLDDGNLFPSTEIPGQYGFLFDGSSLALGDRVDILYRTRSNGRILDGCVSGRVCSRGDMGVDFRVPPTLPGGGDEGPFPSALADFSASIVFGGNSQTFNYPWDANPVQGGLPSMIAYILEQHLGGAAAPTLGPPPPTSISDAEGYYPGQSLSQMAFGGAPDDMIDAIAGGPAGTYDHAVFTSGFRQDGGFPEELPPYNVLLGNHRQALLELAVGGIDSAYIRMSSEGFQIDNESDNTDFAFFVERLIRGARQLEGEGIGNLTAVVPDLYVWYLLQIADPVPGFSSLTHPASLHPGNRRYGWLQRTQASGATFVLNAHQNYLGTIVNAYTWCYALWGVDPTGGPDLFAAPFGTRPNDRWISAAGDQIYLGDSNGTGFLGGATPPDTPSIAPWNATIRADIRVRIRNAVDQYYSGATVFGI